MKIAEGIEIGDWELRERFVLASGPGGQHVNKTASAVELRWNPSQSALRADIKARFERRYASRITQEGDVVILAQKHRDQPRNREDARERLVEMIRAVIVPPKRRIATRPTKGSIKRRLEAKTRRAGIKSLRVRPPGEDD
jgi:ribosome-associated protein